MSGRGMDDAPPEGMTPHHIQMILSGNNGHTANFRYELSETRGWDVRAEFDDRLVADHCSSWRAVEHLYAWLQRKLQ